MTNIKIICGFCELPAVDTPTGTVHGEGIPNVALHFGPGNFVTGNHRPGVMINPADLVEIPEPGTPCGYTAICPNEATTLIDMAPVNPRLPVCDDCAELYERLAG